MGEGGKGGGWGFWVGIILVREYVFVGVGVGGWGEWYIICMYGIMHQALGTHLPCVFYTIGISPGTKQSIHVFPCSVCNQLGTWCK